MLVNTLRIRDTKSRQRVNDAGKVNFEQEPFRPWSQNLGNYETFSENAVNEITPRPPRSSSSRPQTKRSYVSPKKSKNGVKALDSLPLHSASQFALSDMNAESLHTKNTPQSQSLSYLHTQAPQISQTQNARFSPREYYTILKPIQAVDFDDSPATDDVRPTPSQPLQTQISGFTGSTIKPWEAKKLLSKSQKNPSDAVSRVLTTKLDPKYI